MLNFIVLGLVPGTDLQISFIFLLGLVASVLAFLVIDLKWLEKVIRQKYPDRKNTIDLVVHFTRHQATNFLHKVSTPRV